MVILRILYNFLFHMKICFCGLWTTQPYKNLHIIWLNQQVLTNFGSLTLNPALVFFPIRSEFRSIPNFVSVCVLWENQRRYLNSECILPQNWILNKKRNLRSDLLFWRYWPIKLAKWRRKRHFSTLFKNF